MPKAYLLCEIAKKLWRPGSVYIAALIAWNGMISTCIAQMPSPDPIVESNIAIVESNIVLDDSSQKKSTIPLCIPDFLRTAPKKDWLYAQDPFYRTAYQSFSENIGDLKLFFQSYAYLILMPDGIVAHSFEKLVNALEKDGYEIAGCEIFQHDKNTNKLFWAYQSNSFPLQWFKLVDMLLNEKDSVIFLLRDTKASQDNPAYACERLLQLKGHSMDYKRQPWHIRKRIAAGSGLFRYIHSPDDPLCMIREWGVILNSQQIQQLLNGAKNGQKVSKEWLSQIQARVYKNIQVHDLNYQNTKNRLSALAKTLPMPLKEQFLELVDNDQLPGERLLDMIEQHHLEVSEWDIITFCGNRSTAGLPIQPMGE